MIGQFAEIPNRQSIAKFAEFRSSEPPNLRISGVPTRQICRFLHFGIAEIADFRISVALDFPISRAPNHQVCRFRQFGITRFTDFCSSEPPNLSISASLSHQLSKRAFFRTANFPKKESRIAAPRRALASRASLAALVRQDGSVSPEVGYGSRPVIPAETGYGSPFVPPRKPATDRHL